MLKKLTMMSLSIGVIVGCANAQTTPDNQGTMESERISIASHSVRFSDIPGFAALYRGAAVPIMETLVEDGLITGFGVWMHNTGGKYNLRWHLLGMEGTDFEQAWLRITSEIAATDPGALEAFNRSILAHKDETWNIGLRNVESPGDAGYVYENLFQVNRADLSEWNQLWGDVLPALDEAISDGLMRGYIVEEHNMGGEFNWKINVFFDDWDTIDDAQVVFFENIPLDHPIWTMALAHKDELWQRLPEM